LEAKTKGSPEHPRDTAPAREIPEAVDALVMKALARHPRERFQTATEMRQAIDAALEAPARRGRSRLAAAAVIAALAVFAVFAVVGKAPRLRAALASRRSPGKAAVVAAAVPAPSPAPSGEALAAADARRGEDGFDVGEDGDFVDDAVPGGQPGAP